MSDRICETIRVGTGMSAVILVKGKTFEKTKEIAKSLFETEFGHKLGAYKCEIDFMLHILYGKFYLALVYDAKNENNIYLVQIELYPSREREKYLESFVQHISYRNVIGSKLKNSGLDVFYAENNQWIKQ